jgi:hypothetical protein
MTNASSKRIERIVDDFIRSPYMQSREFGCSSDMWIEDPDRAERCESAAEDGCDGSTHQERINDWRETFRDFMRYERRSHNSCELLETAVESYWDDLELWHEKNGTLFQQVW